MYEQEKDKIMHLTILLCYTIFTIILTAEAFLMDWDMGAVLLLLLGVIISWILHISGQFPAEIRLWWYFILIMLTFFYYGIHETSMYDLAPVIILTMILFSLTEKSNYVYCILVTYYLTMLYDFIFVCQTEFDSSPLAISRLLLHLVLVYTSGYICNLIIKRRTAEQKATNDKIFELEEINRRTEHFLTNVSHELRTPINAVTGITTVMLNNESDPLKKNDILAIQGAGRRLFQQIEDILDYTEIDTGRIKISEENYMLSSIINDIIAEERLRDKEHNLEIIFDIDASIPSVLIGDGRKIKKIIKHLLDNAIKFTKKGGVYVRIYALYKSYGINLCINVCDTGIGVEKEQLEKLREKFYQSSNAKMRRAGGLGLGLSIVYGLTSAMEGFVQIESKENSGTTVSVSIPQKIANEAPCMYVENRDELCIACYLKPEKYESPQVREYFNSSISNLVQGLDLTLHRISNKAELDKLISLYRLTHLFVGQEEYIEDENYYEELSSHINILVVAQNDYYLPRDSKLKLVRKPFHSLAVINALNASVNDDEETYNERRMLCPGLKVLVVDDEPMNLMVAEGIFKEYQMEVTTAESGMAAVEICKNNNFDLIFLDHMMPEMDGVETLKLLRKISNSPGNALTVIAFTANAVSGAREMFRQEGFDEFLSKPVENIELERVLKKVLPRSAFVYEDETGEEITSDNTSSNRFLALEKVGIFTRSGLNYCRGDEAFYFELLTKFALDADKKSSEINKFIENDDCENYRIQVHSLKSTSKMIGANSFSEMAKDSEEAAKNNNLDYIKSHNENLLISYWALVNNIKDILEIGQENNSAENCVEITKEEFIEQLKELLTNLETFETDKAELLITQMSEEQYNGTIISELLSEIKQDVENFECSEASSKVNVLIDTIGGSEK